MRWRGVLLNWNDFEDVWLRKQKGTEKYTLWVKIKQDQSGQRMHLCVRTYAWVYTWVCVCMCMSACVLHVYICTCMFTCVHICLCVCVYVIMAWTCFKLSRPWVRTAVWLPWVGKEDFFFHYPFALFELLILCKCCFLKKEKNRGRNVGLVINLEINNFLNLLFKINLFKNIWDKMDRKFSIFLFEEEH